MNYLQKFHKFLGTLTPGERAKMYDLFSIVRGGDDPGISESPLKSYVTARLRSILFGKHQDGIRGYAMPRELDSFEEMKTIKAIDKLYPRPGKGRKVAFNTEESREHFSYHLKDAIEALERLGIPDIKVLNRIRRYLPL